MQLDDGSYVLIISTATWIKTGKMVYRKSYGLSGKLGQLVGDISQEIKLSEMLGKSNIMVSKNTLILSGVF